MASDTKQETEDELLARIQETVVGHYDVSVEEAMDDIRNWGVQPLCEILDSDVTRSGKLLSNKVFSSLYTIGQYVACSDERCGAQLRTQHEQEVEAYLTGHVVPALQEKRDEHLLKEFKRRWENHKLFTEWMRKCFMYLDTQRMRGMEHNTSRTTTSAAMMLFKEKVFDIMKDSIVGTIQTMVNRDRDGELVDIDLVKSVVELFVVMGICSDTMDFKNIKAVVARAASAESGNSKTYLEDFEKPFLKNSAAYYQHKAAAWIAEDSTPGYLNKTERQLEVEGQRVMTYMNPGTKPKLMEEMQKVLLKSQVQKLLHKEGSGLRVLLRDLRYEDISRMYRMFARVGGVIPMAQVLEDHLKEEAMALLRARTARLAADAARAAEAGKKKAHDPTDDPVYIKAWLALYESTKILLYDCLGRHSAFEKSMGNAFAEALASSPGGDVTNAEILCKYYDKVLRGKGERRTDTELDAELEHATCIFEFLRDKDLFAKAYRDLLSARLLGNKSCSQTMEKNVIAKLKMRCGSQLTSKMEKMFNDIASAAEDSALYAPEWAKAGINMEFSVRVLTTGSWPTMLKFTASLPQELQVASDHFGKWYKKKQDSRNLEWLLSTGTAVVTAHLPLGRKRLTVTTMQCIALLCFNKKPTMTFTELVEAIGIDHASAADFVKRVVHPLACARKLDVLTKTPKSSKILPTDTFTVNLKFKHKMMAITYPAPALVAASHGHRQMDGQRKVTIEAATVRIMKARKTLGHQQLVSEVLAQIKLFKPEPRQIKRCIEGLIEREYLERNEDDPRVYNYLS